MNELSRFQPETTKDREAISYIKSKILYIVPSWICNRKKNPCEICFATDIMQSAETGGFQTATGDLLEKAKVLTTLPWKEVILTGGEPFEDSVLLKDTLDVIHPKRKVRIVSNGDWILDEAKRTEILQILKNSKLKIQIDISGHDKFDILRQKVLTLLKNEVRVGVQLRKEEENEYEENNHAHTLEFYKKLLFFEDLEEEVAVETHHALKLGYANTNKDGQRSIGLELSKLIEYTGRDKNVGTYLIPGQGGTRVIGNHETLYLVYETPADIASPEDTPKIVLRKIIDFYATPPNDTMEFDDKTIDYALAAFKANIPLDVNSYELDSRFLKSEITPMIISQFNGQTKKLMDGYYQAIAQKNNLSVDTVRQTVKNQLAKTFILLLYGWLGNNLHHLSDLDLNRSVVHILAEKIPSDPKNMANRISYELLGLHDVPLLDRLYISKLTNGQLAQHKDKDHSIEIKKVIGSKFRQQLENLGFSLEDIVLEMNKLIDQACIENPDAFFLSQRKDLFLR